MGKPVWYADNLPSTNRLHRRRQDFDNALYETCKVNFDFSTYRVFCKQKSLGHNPVRVISVDGGYSDQLFAVQLNARNR